MLVYFTSNYFCVLLSSQFSSSNSIRVSSNILYHLYITKYFHTPNSNKSKMLKTFVKLITRVMKFLRIFPEFFSRKVGSLGERVGTYPRSFASISFLLALFLATGLQRIKFITDMELLFVPTNSPGITVCKKIVAF